MKPGVLTFYRIMAYVTAVLLILLCLTMVLKYAWPTGSSTQQLGDTGTMVIGIAHGYLYLLYLAIALIVTVSLRVSVGRMLLVLLAGTIPFGAFVADRKVTHWYRLRRAGLAIDAESSETSGQARPTNS